MKDTNISFERVIEFHLIGWSYIAMNMTAAEELMFVMKTLIQKS